jgi:DNA-binding HxlR family transcriptional regulator
MRSYGQFCALARSLDVLGDRWNLLIIRELFARDSRYSDLRDGLPGIATNLLADRLRQLQADEVIEAYEAPPPVRATVYRLTDRGRGLGPVMRSLVSWGMPLLATGQAGDAFRPQWLMLVLRILYDDIEVSNVSPLTFVVRSEHEPITVEVIDEGIEVYLGLPPSSPVCELRGDPHGIYRFLTGEDESVAGIEIEGSEDAIQRVRSLIRQAKEARNLATHAEA